MRKVEIKYNPYKMETVVICDGINVCENNRMPKGFKEFIETGTPLQTWIEPVEYRDWPGFVTAIAGKDSNDEIELVFSGRKIDFEDLKRSCETQNKSREKRNQVKFHYTHKDVLDDLELSKNIDEVVRELRSDRFKDLLRLRSENSAVKEKYLKLDENYKRATDSEFQIVFSGIYSSGKSTLINALIGHRILPTSDLTCTSKNCRICHDAAIGTGVSLECFDENGNTVGQKEFFDNDDACLNRFKEISPTQKDVKEEFKSVKTIELCVDLSHLYPGSVSQDKFRLVLIDSPGIDSAHSIENGVNVHASVALEAITTDSKPMIIFCASALKEYDKNIGEFLGRIVQQSLDDNGGFNDRFLFVLNRCDDKKYTGNEKIESFKKSYADYLNNESQWTLRSDKTKEAANFVPRIFLTSAYVAMAIKCGASEYDMAIKKADSDKRNMSEDYEKFAKNVFEYEDENYYLTLNSDIPEYRKNELEKEFETALKGGEKALATEIQCGVVSVEIAIRDYIARYAYPIKVRSLLGTFDSILSDVTEMEKFKKEELEKRIKTLGESEREREGAEKEKQKTQEKNDSFLEAQSNAENQLDKLSGVRFDQTEFGRARTLFEENIEENETIKYIRGLKRVKYLVDTGSKSREEVEEDISKKLRAVERVFNQAIRLTKEKFSEIAQAHDRRLEDICSQLKDIVNGLKDSGMLQLDGYDFENSTIWNDKFQNLNVSVLRTEVQKKIKDYEVYDVEVYNPRRWELECGNWFERNILAKFHRKYITEVEEISGKYSLKPIIAMLDESYVDLNKQITKMQQAYDKELAGMKSKVREMVKELLSQINECRKDIKIQTKKIRELGNSIKVLEKEKEICQETCDWLSELKVKIKGA